MLRFIAAVKLSWLLVQRSLFFVNERVIFFEPCTRRNFKTFNGAFLFKVPEDLWRGVGTNLRFATTQDVKPDWPNWIRRPPSKRKIAGSTPALGIVRIVFFLDEVSYVLFCNTQEQNGGI